MCTLCISRSAGTRTIRNRFYSWIAETWKYQAISMAYPTGVSKTSPVVVTLLIRSVLSVHKERTSSVNPSELSLSVTLAEDHPYVRRVDQSQSSQFLDKRRSTAVRFCRNMDIQTVGEPQPGRNFRFTIQGGLGTAKIEAYLNGGQVLEVECPDPPCHEMVFVPANAFGQRLDPDADTPPAANVDLRIFDAAPPASQRCAVESLCSGPSGSQGGQSWRPRP